MGIKSIELENFLIFHESTNLHFEKGINVLIGENGCGKTTILKTIYMAAQWSNADINKNPWTIADVFCPTADNTFSLLKGGFKIKVTDGDESFYFYDGSNYNSEWFNKHIQAVFIPTTEMLSHSKGFLALNHKYKLPFDATQIDIIANASLPDSRKIPENLEGILDKISKAIDGTVVVEDDTFFVIKSDGRKIEFSLEAEGLRKLGLIWKLIRNGLIEEGSILLWDEPEANLNPELYSLVADILVELQNVGVQIFVATHSYNFAKYLEIKTYDKEKTLFFTLYRNSDGIIETDVSYNFEESKNNPMVIAENRLLDTILD